MHAERVYESGAPEPMGEPVTFTLDGYKYICRELNALELSEIARLQGRPADSPEAIAFMAELFETLLGRQEYQLFRQRCGQFQPRPELLVRIIEGVFEDFTDRPTGPLSDSSGGQRSTGGSLTGDSSSQAMDLLSKRPDLQVAILAAEEERTVKTVPRNRLSRD